MTLRSLFEIALALLVATGCSGEQSADGDPAVKTADHGSPFGLHIGVTRPYLAPGEQPSGQSFDYTDATYLGIGWERPGPYARFPFDPVFMDVVYGSVPSEMGIFANIETPRVPGSFALAISDEEYSSFVRSVVERYDGDGIDDMPDLPRPILHWQIDNEPPFWQLGVTDGLTDDPQGWPPLTRDDYARVVGLARDAVDSACPKCKLFVGGLIDMGNQAALVQEFYRPVLETLRGRRVDGIDIHVYGEAGDYRHARDAYTVVRDALDATDHADTEVWITETSAYSGAPIDPASKAPLPARSEAEQAAELVKRMLYPLSLGVAKTFWWSMVEGYAALDDNDPGDGMGLLYDGIGDGDPGHGARKLAFWTLELLIDELRATDIVQVEPLQDAEDVVVLRIDRRAPLGPVFVAWTDEPAGATAHVPSSAARVKLIQVVPSAAAGTEFTAADYPQMFQSATDTAVLGTVSIDLNLGQAPVIVEPLP